MNRLLSIWHALRTAPLHTKLRLLRWNAPLLVVAMAAVHQFVVQTAVRPFSGLWSWWIELLIYSLTGSVAAWIGLTVIAAAVARRAAAEEELRQAFKELEINHHKLLALDRLGQHIAHADDEQAVLELTAQAPIQLTDARSSTVVTFDLESERLKLDMAWGLSEHYLRALRSRLEAGVSAERCRHCTVLHARSTSDCPLFEGLQTLAQSEGIGSVVCLPIRREEQRVGILSAYFPSANGPPEEQIRLLNILGGVVASALDSLRARARQIETLQALDRAAQAAEALDALCSQALGIAMEGWNAKTGGLFLYDEEEDVWSCRAQRGLDGVDSTSVLDLALRLSKEARRLGAPIISELDAHETPKLAAAACAPLITEGRVLGTLFLAVEQPGALHERHRDLLSTMAYQIALAVRNAQLYLEVHEMTVVRERLRLSREIHDGLAQTLGFLNLQAEHLGKLVAQGRADEAEQELAAMRQVIRGAYVDAREAIDGLRLSQETPEALAQNLEQYVQNFARQTGINAQFTVSPPELSTDPTTALQLLRIAQEALTNVRKHAQADQVEVRLIATDDEIELSVADDGRGFQLMEQNGAHSSHYRSHGLASMRERVESLGGSLTVATEPGRGARITAVVPTNTANNL
ncbi:MAG: GAF domain-containing sensor histidine kinase [Chloroflexi bacterium]|nr:GAF domain-containing sensor histidine kinase [Chloroflexota bacterium]